MIHLNRFIIGWLVRNHNNGRVVSIQRLLIQRTLLKLLAIHEEKSNSPHNPLVCKRRSKSYDKNGHQQHGPQNKTIGNIEFPRVVACLRDPNVDQFADQNRSRNVSQEVVKDGRNTDSKGTQIGRGGFENNKCPGWVRSKDGNAPNKEEEDKKIAVGHGECIGTAEDNGAHSETRNETPTRKQH